MIDDELELVLIWPAVRGANLSDLELPLINNLARILALDLEREDTGRRSRFRIKHAAPWARALIKHRSIGIAAARFKLLQPTSRRGRRCADVAGPAGSSRVAWAECHNEM